MLRSRRPSEWGCARLKEDLREQFLIMALDQERAIARSPSCCRTTPGSERPQGCDTSRARR